MALGIITSLAQPIIDYAIKPIVHQFGYLIHYNRNVAALEEEIHKLENEQAGVIRRVDAATSTLQVPLPSVTEWLENVDQVKDGAGLFLQNQVKANQRCYKWLMFPDLLSRYKVSRWASKKKADIVALTNEATVFDRVATPGLIPPVEAMFGGHVEELESRRRIFEEVMEALKDDNVRMIGMYGMGGIGKTTLAKQVAVEAKKRNLFSETAMAAVSQNPNVSKIQQDIAEHLGLKFEQENVQVRAGKLYERLSQSKGVLLILDDLWDTLELSDVGIPPSKSCKIILTSRNKDVCTKMLSQADKKFQIDVLAPADGLCLFQNEIGAAIESQELLRMATKIVEKCQGLPLAIKAVARALKGQSHDSWILALRHFEKSTPEKIDGMSKDVYSVLEYSFTSLEPAEKLCFLICRLFEEDADIPLEDVMRYGMGLGMLPDVDHIEDAKITVRELVKRLKARGLLLAGKDDKSVRMHDVIRDLAKLVVSTGRHGHQSLLKEGELVNAWPDISRMKEYTAISLLNTGIAKLPETVDCPKLEVFKFRFGSGCRGDDLIQLNRELIILKIPESFFAKMTELKVLVIQGAHIPSLPQSIMSLKKLQILCLEDCSLGENISFIGELKDLKILSMCGSLITEVPKKFEQLTQLMILDLTFCVRIRVIPSNLISMLTRLECLYMYNSFREWGEGSNATLDELKYLPYLTTLQIMTKVFPKDLLLQKVMTFRFIIDMYMSANTILLTASEGITERELVMDGFEVRDSDLPGGLKTLVERAQLLKLDLRRNILKSALDCLKRNGFANLRYFFVREMKIVEKEVEESRIENDEKENENDEKEIKEQIVLIEEPEREVVEDEIELGLCDCSELRELRISCVRGLTNLWKKSASYAFLGSLKKVDMCLLHTLKSVFPQHASVHLGQLETLIVWRCWALEELFEEDDEIMLSSLKNLHLEVLPSLRSFGSDRRKPIPTPSFFDEKVKLPALEDLAIARCTGLRYMFSASMINKNFNHLKELKIVECWNLEQVVVEEEEAEQGAFSVEFSCVENLKLVSLPKLRSFCSKDYTFTWPSLRTMELNDCPNMQTFCSGTLFTPKLMDIRIDYEKVDQGDLNSAIRIFFERKSHAIGFESVSWGHDIEAKGQV